jgi:ABC-2 type transport system ATP-binding protein
MRSGTAASAAVAVTGLTYAYGTAEAVHDLSFEVRRGRCYGLFGRNGAGKTTTMRCLLNLLQPRRGSVRVLGLDPARDGVDARRRLAFVPDAVAFYPWMSIRETLDYLASFRAHWNRDTERDLLERFRLDPSRKAGALSKGQRTQVALIAAICPEPELLLLDEPTSGLDPIVRREFIQTVIGAYQAGDPANRTIVVSTHLIAEFEGLIDEFTILHEGRALLTLEADRARERYRRVRARFAREAPAVDWPGAVRVQRRARELDVVTEGDADRLLAEIGRYAPEWCAAEPLTLEEIFVAALS